MSKSFAYQHWRLEEDVNQILWLGLDKANALINTLDSAVLSELQEILTGINADPKSSIKGIAIYSEKESGFIAGADITTFKSSTDIEAVLSLIQLGQTVFKILEDLAIPSIAIIDGFCLGGGLELALACRYRIATLNPKTHLGLPEIKLGIHPGWGGTVRLPALIGAWRALDLILSGRSIDVKLAAKWGIVDSIVPEIHLKQGASHYLLKQVPRFIAKPWQIGTNAELIRPLLAKFFHYKLAKKINKDHYPAPYIVLKNWREHGVKPEALTYEALSISKLIFTEQAQNLIRIFLLQERLKSFAKGSHFHAQHVHVIGAGVMGSNIAAWCAAQGANVTLQDREDKMFIPAMRRAGEFFSKHFKNARLAEEAFDRLLPDVKGYGLTRADLIIEAIYEDLSSKQALFKVIEQTAKPDAILATNTSSIPLAKISSVLTVPQRLIGIHFFNPVAKMPLVEVVVAPETDKEVVQQALRWVCNINHLPLLVRSSPGFLVNRILIPYFLEAFFLMEEGLSKQYIDRVATDFGMPMGPVQLADTVGLDICLAAISNVAKDKIPERLQSLVQNGCLGKKTGKGFYEYTVQGKPKLEEIAFKNNIPILDRLIYALLNEAIACLREKIVADPESLDAGVVFGMGFPPFRGGLIQYAKQQGIAQVITRFKQLAQAYGERFMPDPAWFNLEKEIENE